MNKPRLGQGKNLFCAVTIAGMALKQCCEAGA
jgi:hypothetical protein